MPKRGIPDQPVPRPAAHSRTSPPDARPLPDLCPPTPVPADDSALSATAQALDDQGTPRLLAGKSSLDRHHRQRGEDAVFGIKLHGHSGEHSLPRGGRGATHRPHEIGCIGEGEHLFDVQGLLPVGRQRDRHLFEHQALFHQPAAHHQLGLAQIPDRRCGAELPRPANWEEGVR